MSFLGFKDGEEGAFSPELILPAQWYAHVKATEPTPEQRLYIAVIENGMRHYLGRSKQKLSPLVVDTRNGLRAGEIKQAEAERWIFGPPNSWIVSFGDCCDILHIDAEWLRRQLKALRRRVDNERARESRGSNRTVTTAVKSKGSVQNAGKVTCTAVRAYDGKADGWRLF